VQIKLGEIQNIYRALNKIYANVQPSMRMTGQK